MSIYFLGNLLERSVEPLNLPSPCFLNRVRNERREADGGECQLCGASAVGAPTVEGTFVHQWKPILHKIHVNYESVLMVVNIWVIVDLHSE